MPNHGPWRINWKSLIDGGKESLEKNTIWANIWRWLLQNKWETGNLKYTEISRYLNVIKVCILEWLGHAVRMDGQRQQRIYWKANQKEGQKREDPDFQLDLGNKGMSVFVHGHSKASKSHPFSSKKQIASSQASRRPYIFSCTAETRVCCKHGIECKKTLCKQNADILGATLVLLTTEI